VADRAEIAARSHAPTYMELLEDAWVLQPGTKRRPPGFVRGSELRDKEIWNPGGMLRHDDD